MTDHPNSLLAFVEIPRGSRNKYEYDEETKTFRLDRVLYSSVHYPTDYGFIPNTLAPDGDHLDVLVLVEEPTFPGCMIEIRPLGGSTWQTRRAPTSRFWRSRLDDPRYAQIDSLEDLGEHWLREIETFFAPISCSSPKQTEVLGWHSLEETRQVIADCRRAYERVRAARVKG